MKTISKVFYYGIIIFLMAWMLPSLYNFFMARPLRSPSYMYSPVVKEFAHMEFGNGKTKYMDGAGREYTQQQFDSILPVHYWHVLNSRNQAPDSLNGYALNRMSLAMGMANGGGRPEHLHSPSLGVKEIMDAKPYRLALQDPDQVFRFTEDEMQIISKRGNKLDTLKSRLFTEALNEAGVQWPIRRSSGNPTSRKSFDFGYILLDSNREVYHMVQYDGKPVVKKTSVTPDMNIKLLRIKEPMSKAYLGFLISEEGHLSMLKADYSVQPLGVTCDLEVNSFWMMGNLLTWTFEVSDDKGYTLYAMDAHTYEILKTERHEYPAQAFKEYRKWLFPVMINFEHEKDKYIYPQFNEWSAKALILNVLLAIILIFVQRKRKDVNYWLVGTTAVTGLFGFIPALFIKEKS